MISVAAFDFENKALRELPWREAAGACAAGEYCWIDINCAACEGAGPSCKECADCLKSLGVSDFVVAEILGPDQEGRYDVYDDCLHFAVTEARVVEERLQTAHVDVLLASSFLVTYRKKEADLIVQMKRTYKEDFRKFAKTPGFLLYEIGDHLTERYRKAMHSFATAIEKTQLRLFADVDDGIFKQVSDLTSDILVLRKVVLASRELFHELSTRKSVFISETTQPFLANMAGTLDRLAGDLSVERDVLTNTLGTYMGIVSHRTGKVVNRLTVISMIFLPLSFLCGVYGVNLKGVPEFEWEHGYAYFWSLCILIAGLALLIMYRKKWL